MAGAITHLLVVEQAAKGVGRLTPELAGPLRRARPFLLLGSVSPDLPYAMVGPLANDSVWADRMHYLRTSSLGLVGALDLGHRNLLGTSEGDAELAWLAGFVAHCITDAVVHPIVQAIVGPYHAAKTDHRVCEMVQDSLLYSDILGHDLHGSRYVGQLKSFIDKGKEQFLGVVGFWFILLKQVYGDLPPKPDPERWHDAYASLLSVAEDSELALVLSRTAPGLRDYVYSSAGALREERQEEAERCYDLVPNPGHGGKSSFKVSGFNYATEKVLLGWGALYHDVFKAKEIRAGTENARLPAYLKNWNLDTGADMDQIDTRVTFWPGALGS